MTGGRKSVLCSSNPTLAAEGCPITWQSLALALHRFPSDTSRPPWWTYFPSNRESNIPFKHTLHAHLPSRNSTFPSTHCSCVQADPPPLLTTGHHSVLDLPSSKFSTFSLGQDPSCLPDNLLPFLPFLDSHTEKDNTKVSSGTTGTHKQKHKKIKILVKRKRNLNI